MGNSQSQPIDLVLQHYGDFKDRATEMGLRVRKGRLQTFVNTEWPTFGVGWPFGGTWDKAIISAVRARVLLPGREGHPDQMPYILTWQSLAQDPPSWLKPYTDLIQALALTLDKQATVSEKNEQPGPSTPPVLLAPEEPLLDLSLPPPYNLPAPLYPPLPGEAQAAPPAQPSPPPAHRTRGRTPPQDGTTQPSSTVALPVRTVGPVVPGGP